VRWIGCYKMPSAPVTPKRPRPNDIVCPPAPKRIRLSSTSIPVQVTTATKCDSASTQ